MSGANLEWRQHLRGRPKPPRAHDAVITTDAPQVVRLPDRVAVPALSISLSTDYDSRAWSLRMALLDPLALSLVNPVRGEPL